MDLQTWLAFFGGLVLLIGGAEIMVRGAVGAARPASLAADTWRWRLSLGSSKVLKNR